MKWNDILKSKKLGMELILDLIEQLETNIANERNQMPPAERFSNAKNIIEERNNIDNRIKEIAKFINRLKD